MTIENTAQSMKKTARIAGLWYLVLAITGGFGILYIPTLIVPGDASATVTAIREAEGMYRLAFVSGLISQISFIPLVLALYKLLKPVNRNHAVLMVALALVSIPITMLNQLNQAAALILAHAPDYLSVFPAEQLQAQVMFFLELSDYGVYLVEIFWGLWLLPFGWLAFKSGYIPKLLGILVIINGLAYVVDFLTYFLLPGFGVTIVEYIGYGEIFIMLWLLIKGVNVEAWEKRTEELEMA